MADDDIVIRARASNVGTTVTIFLRDPDGNRPDRIFQETTTPGTIHPTSHTIILNDVIVGGCALLTAQLKVEIPGNNIDETQRVARKALEMDP